MKMEPTKPKQRIIDICSIIGWLVSGAIVLYCTFTNTNAPFIAELYVICTASLLGLDEAFKGFIKYKINKSNKEGNPDDKIEKVENSNLINNK